MQRRSLWFAVAAVLLAAAGLNAEKKPRPWASALPALVKLGPGAPTQGEPAIALSAARGECEAAQIVARGPIADVRAHAQPLVHGAEKLEARLYREEFLDVKEPSNAEGRTGRWADALIPEVDAYGGEARRAFPASAGRGETVGVYFEVCVPANAPAGEYQGAVELTARSHPSLKIPVTLRVRAFQLPATSTLPTTFGFSGIAAAIGHGKPSSSAEVQRLTHLYALAALRHRISLHGMSMDPPPFDEKDGKLRLDFREYDKEVGPFLDGTALPGGARFTSIDVRLHPAAKTEAQKIAYWKAFAAHLREKGWLDRAFIYAKDEPKPEELPQVRAMAALAHKADPALRVLVTASLDSELVGAADLFTPNINCLFERPGSEYCSTVVPFEAYEGERQKGRQLWWYQSCGSHACAPIGAADLDSQTYYRGWPSYMVDHPAVLNRAMGALAFRYGADGELYYNTVEAWLTEDGKRADPWKSLWRFSGNGDGTLFYPGTPKRIGGATDVPIESLRLKHLRDGLEDYEYLALARKVGLREEARAAAEALTPQPFAITRNIETWARVREELASKIEGALARPGEYAAPRAVNKASGP